MTEILPILQQFADAFTTWADAKAAGIYTGIGIGCTLTALIVIFIGVIIYAGLRDNRK